MAQNTPQHAAKLLQEKAAAPQVSPPNAMTAYGLIDRDGNPVAYARDGVLYDGNGVPIGGSTATTNAYTSLLGSTPDDVAAIDAFYRKLASTTDGAAALAALVDGVLLRALQNNAAAPITLNGATVTLSGSPSFTQRGVLCDATGKHGIFPVAATPVFTLIAEIEQSDVQQASAFHQLFGICNSGGTSVAGQVLTTDTAVYSGAGGVSGEQGATVVHSQSVGATGQIGVGDNATCLQSYNPQRQIVTAAYDNAPTPNIDTYIDGVFVRTITNTVKCTSALDRVFFGENFIAAPATWGNPGKIWFSNIFLFAGVLTQAQVSAFVEAVLLLNSNMTRHFVVVGDSQTALSTDAARRIANVPYQLMQTDYGVGRRLFNQASGGTSATFFDTNFATILAPFIDSSTDFLIWLGTAGIFFGDSAATNLAAVQSICRKAQALGARITVCTLPNMIIDGSTGWTAAMEAIAVTYNASARLLKSTGYCDRVVDLRAALSYSDAADPVLMLDDIHANLVGNQLFTGFIANATQCYVNRVTAAGTVFPVPATASIAAVTFGTTSPALVLSAPGRYRIRFQCTLKYTGATFAANQAVTLKLRRTNNTAADLTGGTTAGVITEIVTTVTKPCVEVTWEAAPYSTLLANDAITIFAGVAAAPGAGSLDITAAFISAERIGP